jgi:hypothetical protein
MYKFWVQHLEEVDRRAHTTRLKLARKQCLEQSRQVRVETDSKNNRL